MRCSTPRGPSGTSCDPTDDATRVFLAAAVDTAARVWREDDQGIWEIRGPARPFVHSKLMCWVALDRGIRLAEDGVLDAAAVERWAQVREEIRTDIEASGWNERVGAFTQSYGSDELDASVLLMAMVGFLPAD